MNYFKSLWHATLIQKFRVSLVLLQDMRMPTGPALYFSEQNMDEVKPNLVVRGTRTTAGG
jgi:hypothetical protein